jgi:hypothetical protein
MIGIGIVVEAGDFDPAGRSVELQRLGQGAVGVELQHRNQKGARYPCVVDWLLDLYNDRASFISAGAEALMMG